MRNYAVRYGLPARDDNLFMLYKQGNKHVVEQKKPVVVGNTREELLAHLQEVLNTLLELEKQENKEQLGGKESK